MSRVEVTLLHAEGDGVAPCFIVSLCSEKGYVRPMQYLFNVPEGFSRLALEHRARPGLGLKSIFISNGVSPRTCGGLGGLILRLKADGHGEIQLIGPPGVNRVLTGLREGIEILWSNPQVHVKEVAPDDCSSNDYQDGEVQVQALFFQRHWTPPSFLSPSPRLNVEGRQGDSLGLKEEQSDDEDSPMDSSLNESKDESLFSSLDKMLSSQSKGSSARAKGRVKAKGSKGGGSLKSKVLKLLKSRESKGHALSTKTARGDGDDGQEGNTEDSTPCLFGYLMHFKSSSRVLLIISCSHLLLLDPLSKHPLFAKNGPGLNMLHKTNRLLCTLHLTTPHLTKTARYQEWMKRLPGPHHVFSSSELPAPRPVPIPSTSLDRLLHTPSSVPALSQARNLGFVASARVSMKLNRVSTVLFPLPDSLLGQASSLKGQEDPEDQSTASPPPRLLALRLMGQLKMSLGGTGRASFEVVHPTREEIQKQETENSDLLSSLAQLHQQVPELNQSSQVPPPTCFHFLQPAHPPPLPPIGWLVSTATYILDLQQGLIPRFESRRHLAVARPRVDNRLRADEVRKMLKNDDINAVIQPPGNLVRQCPAPTCSLSPSTLIMMAKIDEDPIPPCLTSVEATHARLSFLGTGSAEPSKHRGPSAILLQLPGGGLLMDVGEGCWGQLIRAHGEAEAIRVVASLRVIWISHKHADHTLGLIQILNARPLGSKTNALVIVGPSAVGKWLQIHFASDEAKPASWSFIHSSQFNSSRTHQDAAVASSMSCLGLSQWKSVPVHHCKESYALVISSMVGWKIVYSGDCRPSSLLQDEGKDATLLIHESTFDPSLGEMALQKRHSTSDEAIEVARGMRAYRTILSHFSQRYPKMPEGLTSAGSSSSDPLKSLREIPMVAFDAS